MDKGKQMGAFMTGAMIGSLVGAAIALLNAPCSGEETRTKIKDKSVEIKELTLEKGEEVRVKTDEFLNEARGKFEETTQMTRERALELQTRGQEFLDEQRTRLNEAIDAGKKAATQKQAELVTEGNGQVAEEAA
jgi:gas vesicle protein